MLRRGRLRMAMSMLEGSWAGPDWAKLYPPHLPLHERLHRSSIRPNYPPASAKHQQQIPRRSRNRICLHIYNGLLGIISYISSECSRFLKTTPSLLVLGDMVSRVLARTPPPWT